MDRFSFIHKNNETITYVVVADDMPNVAYDMWIRTQDYHLPSNVTYRCLFKHDQSKVYPAVVIPQRPRTNKICNTHSPDSTFLASTEACQPQESELEAITF